MVTKQSELHTTPWPPISGKGKISSCAGFSLHNVLHVSKISYDLVSISKITPKLNCKATFLPTYVSF